MRALLLHAEICGLSFMRYIFFEGAHLRLSLSNLSYLLPLFPVHYAPIKGHVLFLLIIILTQNSSPASSSAE
jgi:hypothetical protein